jgi:hypothetical protein
VTGGSIDAPAECLRFTGSTGNVIAGVALTGCPTGVRAESPAAPTSNTVIGELTGEVRLDAGSTLNVGRPLAVQVRAPGGAPVAGAQVEARDASGRTAFAVATDETGSIPAQVAISASRTASATLARPPLTLRVASPGYRTATVPVPPAGPATVEVLLEPQP